MNHLRTVLAGATSLAVLCLGTFQPLLAASPSESSATPSDTSSERIKKLHSLLDEQWQYTLRTNPEFASILGDKRYNDRLNDYSQTAIAEDIRRTRQFLEKFEAIDATGFPEQEKLNRDLMVGQLREQLDGVKFKNWEIPVTQLEGPHIDLPQLVASLSFTSLKDYEDYVARLKQIPRSFDQTIVQMRKGMADGLIPPRILLVQVAEQAHNIATQKPENTPFALPTTKFPKTIAPADRTRLRRQVIAAVRDLDLPAYRKFETFVRTEYAPKGRTAIGLWALPDGAERYAYAIRSLTTTEMSPEAIHQLGLSEVARIETEELIIAKKLGFTDLKSLNASLKSNSQLHPKSAQQILDEYRTYTDQMWQQMPKLFGLLPKAKPEILPIESYREKQYTGAEYKLGAPDGSRPGRILVSTYDYRNQLTITNESTAYHEGVPGHHMQIAIAQQLSGLPPFRQLPSYTAFVEGWALYAERLGKEVGFYTNPYNDYGRLEDEKWRAIRLVVDTGIHFKRWTRDQVVQYMRDHSSSNEANIQSETDRYIAWPSQALAYKIGQLTILRLREKATQRLGDRFDIRAFHDEVLGAGALPLDVLEKRIDQWIAQTGGY